MEMRFATRFDGAMRRVLDFIGPCNVEAECHFCYLRDSGVYVHESCCLGVQRHLPTYMKRRKCQDGPETYMQQIWYLISVTENVSRVRPSRKNILSLKSDATASCRIYSRRKISKSF